MVDSDSGPESETPDDVPIRPGGHRGRRSSVLVAATVAVMATALIVGLTVGNAPAPVSLHVMAPANRTRPAARTSTPAPVAAATSSAPATTPTTTTPVPVTTAPVNEVQTVVVPSVASLVAQVEAAGIEPGPSWSWSMGDPSTQCGRIDGAGSATGCTSWASGVETTVFSGSPSLALVAHEVANAETEYSALPSLVTQVAAEAGATSWSPTDAVASCLVEHFMGFQDGAAGSWQCPPALATEVADHIHDTVTTTRTTAVCGTASGVSSTLTFTADSGTLSVVTPAGATPVTAPVGTPVTVSGIGTFIATDQGGTATLTGVCTA